MDLFKPLQKKLKYLAPKQIERIHEAYEFASHAHSGQTRKSGEKYVSHPLAVASILTEMNMDTDSIIAALLHDVVEDTDIDKNTLVKKFGQTVADLVDGVTKLTMMSFSTVAEAQAENLRKMVLAMSHDIRVILVKLADRVHNMRTIDSLPTYKRHRIAKETLEIYAPIANRLGIRDVFEELKSLSFLALYPHRYQVLKDAIKKARGNRKEIMSIIEKEIKKQLTKSKVTKFTLVGREKSVYSIYRKMHAKHLSFSEIMDVYAVRIIVESIDACYRTVGIIHSLYKPIPEKFKDYIAIPKINGYQCLHTSVMGPHGVPVEIQIRTKQMDQMANKGIAAHWLYKYGEAIDESHIRAQQWINDLLELQQSTGNSLEFIENVKTDLFPEEIYVFTPKGKIIKLPLGSTPVDFAYALHTDVGNTCVAATIDRQFAPLSTELTNGQTITITTTPRSRPNPAWLNFIGTAKARSAIRYFLKRQQKSEAIALGKELLNKAVHDLAPNIKRIPKKTYKAVLDITESEDIDTLYEDIGLGNRVSAFVAHQLITASKYKPTDKESETTEPKEKPLLIKGAEGMVIHLANCCNPVPGDPIVACISAGHGLTVHRDNCHNIAKLRRQPEKCILVGWSDAVKGDFTVLINVDMSSKRGAFAQLTKIIFETDASLENIDINKRTGDHYSTTMKLFVRNLKHLSKILRNLNKVSIVTKAERAE